VWLLFCYCIYLKFVFGFLQMTFLDYTGYWISGNNFRKNFQEKIAAKDNRYIFVDLTPGCKKILKTQKYVLKNVLSLSLSNNTFSFKNLIELNIDICNINSIKNNQNLQKYTFWKFQYPLRKKILPLKCNCSSQSITWWLLYWLSHHKLIRNYCLVKVEYMSPCEFQNLKHPKYTKRKYRLIYHMFLFRCKFIKEKLNKILRILLVLPTCPRMKVKRF